jgi:hypothetical protein
MPGVNKGCQSKIFWMRRRLLVGISTCGRQRPGFAQNCDSRVYGITDGDLGLADLLRLLCQTSIAYRATPACGQNWSMRHCRWAAASSYGLLLPWWRCSPTGSKSWRRRAGTVARPVCRRVLISACSRILALPAQTCAMPFRNRSGTTPLRSCASVHLSAFKGLVQTEGCSVRASPRCF